MDKSSYTGKSPNLNKRVALAMACLCLAVATGASGAQAQSTNTRGAHRVPLSAVTTQGEKLTLYQQSHALLIGVSDYTEGWPDLRSIPAELDQLEAVLRAQEFNVQRLRNPNRNELRAGVREFIDQYGYDADNRLLIFFSGHGHSEGDKGFLVPVNAPLPSSKRLFRRNVIPMSDFMNWARDIETRHALFMFDSCFSGSIFKSRNPPRGEYVRRATGQPVRQFLTAGSADETVPAKSVFVPEVIKAIQGAGDSNNDGYVTGSELGLYITQTLPEFSEQTPQYGRIRDRDLRQGDFVFFSGSNASVPEQSTVSEPTPNLEYLLWQSAERGDTVAEYQAYLDRFPQGLFNGIAQARIERFQSRETPDIASVSILSRPATPASTGRLTIKAEPSDSRVRIMNIVPRYRAEMELDLNRGYDVLVTKDGYEPWRRNVKLEEPEQVVAVVLRKRSLPVVPVKPARKAFEPEMVLVEGGCFQMGSPASERGRDRDERQHRVCVKNVYAGVHEVTFAQYDVFAKAVGKDLPDDEGWGRGDRPVINVSGFDATRLREVAQRTYR